MTKSIGISRRTAALLCMSFSIFAVCFWMGQIGTGVDGVYSTEGAESSSQAFLLGIAAFAVMMIVLGKRLDRYKMAMCVMAVVVMCASSLIVEEGAGAAPALVLVGSFFSSGCYFYLLSYACIALAKSCESRTAAICFAVGFALSSIAIPLGQQASSGFRLVLLCVLPPLVTVSFLATARLLGEQGREANYFKRKTTPWNSSSGLFMLAITFVAGFLMAYVRIAGGLDIWGLEGAAYGSTTNIFFLTLVDAAAIVVALLLFSINKKPIAVQCVASIAVVTAVAQFLVIQNDHAGLGDLGSYLFVATQVLARTTVWVATLMVVRTIEVPVLRLAGLCCIPHVLTCFLWMFILGHTELSGMALPLIADALIALLLVRLLLDWRAGKLSVGAEHDQSERLMDFASDWGLTNRELDVCALLIQGMSRKEICAELYLSEGTVNAHVANIYKKLDVHSRSELAQVYERWDARALSA